jgi:hypothetical protein
MDSGFGGSQSTKQCCKDSYSEKRSKNMNPRFGFDAIPDLVQRYWNYASPAQREREQNIMQNRAPAFQERRYLSLEDMVVLTQWKSPRTVPWVNQNGDPLVREVTRLSLSQNISEELRIEILTLLDGVQLRVASVVLHFAFVDKYPILDYRALWSLQEPQPKAYTFDLWKRYTDFCRRYIAEHQISMRDFDKALWTYSRENQ